MGYYLSPEHDKRFLDHNLRRASRDCTVGRTYCQGLFTRFNNSLRGRWNTMALSTSFEDFQFHDAPNMEEVPGPESQRLIENQLAQESNAVKYPRRTPIAIDEGRGATLRDVDGNTYLDFYAGIGVLNVGHSNPYVVEGVKEQLDKLVHSVDFPTEGRFALMEKLDEIAPTGLSGRNRVLFGGPTGSDAIEATMKVAMKKTGGHGFIAFRGGYHGATAGALSLCGMTKYREDYAPLIGDVVHLPYPYPFQQEISPEEAVQRSLDEVQTVLGRPDGGLANPAGIWVEPIQGQGGIVIPPEGFLEGLRDLADEHEVPLIIDEIQTGFGRTGEWFGCEHYGVKPDMMPLGKAIGGIGLPLSATVLDEDFDALDPGGHVGTFRGHIPAMVAGVRAIEYIQDQRLLEHSREMGEYILSRMEEIKGETSTIGDVRGRGLFIGVEFVDDDGAPDKELAKTVQIRCFERGVLVRASGRMGNVLRFVPPLVITKEQARIATDIVEEVIRDLDREH